jgi:hypothetical protein
LPGGKLEKPGEASEKKEKTTKNNLEIHKTTHFNTTLINEKALNLFLSVWYSDFTFLTKSKIRGLLTL